jgi:hypothetical protein
MNATISIRWSVLLVCIMVLGSAALGLRLGERDSVGMPDSHPPLVILPR